MRSWVVSPGTMLSNWESVRYAGITALGIAALVAAILAMLYTSAATALVQPRLKFTGWSAKSMQGQVKASFANMYHIAEDCHSPLPPTFDRVHRAETCLSIEHAAMGYHNYYSYLKLWSEVHQDSSLDSSFLNRPNGTALLNNDTLVIAPWVDNRLNHSAAVLWNDTSIILNNVSLSFPHVGVASASKDTINEIMQPGDLDGLGIYRINASVPSPVVHVLCATLSGDQLVPLVYENWTETSGPVDAKEWPKQLNYTEKHPYPYLGGTELDDIFGWGEKYGSTAWPPVFPKLPKDYNTMTNLSSFSYGRTSIYVLGKAPDDYADATPEADYFLCQMQVSQTPYCYTSYQASAQGATLEAVCGDENSPHEMQYIASIPDAKTGNDTLSKDWLNVAGQWALALALNDGSFDGDSSNARLLSQLLLREPKLDPTKPSLAEALAVLAGCTLLQSTLDAPFVPFWDYSENVTTQGILNDPNGVYEPFNATIRAQRYAAGGSQAYQKAFHIVLLGVFMLNVMTLLYFLLHKKWYIDFSEPSTLFSLAVNSPPSEAFSGCCGSGPQGKDYGVTWTLEQDGGHVFVHSGARPEVEGNGSESPKLKRRKVWRSMSGSPMVQNLGKLRRWSRDV